MVNVLIVDDSRTVRAMVKKSLRMGDVEVSSVHEAGNGQEGLDVLEKEWVDIIFTDINMPVMGGFEFIDRVSEDADHNTIPIVIISTDTIEAKKEELEAKGVRGYVRKPFTPEQMNGLLQNLVKGG